MENTREILRVDELGIHYKKPGFDLQKISFSLEEGYMMCLLGKNGAGKTTLLKAIYGLMELTSGSVSFTGEVVFSADRKGLQTGSNVDFRNHAAFVGEGDRYMEDLSMEENVNTLKAFYRDFDEAEYARLLELFDIKKSDEEKRYCGLSAGLRVLFPICFALARHPKLLLLDEPFAHLDPVIKVDITELLQAKIRDENMTVIISTHLVDEISNLVDVVGVLEHGVMTQFGDRETLLQNKGLRDYILTGSGR